MDWQMIYITKFEVYFSTLLINSRAEISNYELEGRFENSPYHHTLISQQTIHIFLTIDQFTFTICKPKMETPKQ